MSGEKTLYLEEDDESREEVMERERKAFEWLRLSAARNAADEVAEAFTALLVEEAEAGEPDLLRSIRALQRAASGLATSTSDWRRIDADVDMLRDSLRQLSRKGQLGRQARERATLLGTLELADEAVHREVEALTAEDGAVGSGAAEVASGLVARRASASNEQLAQLAARTNELKEAVATARERLQAAGLIGAARVRRVLVEGFASAMNDSDLITRAGQNLDPTRMERWLREAEKLRELANACAAASIALGPEGQATVVELERASSDWSALSAVLGKATVSLPMEELRAKLRVRAEHAAQVVRVMTAPEWSERLREWREGFAGDLVDAVRASASGHWAGAGQVLGELNEFLRTRALLRFDLLRRGAKEANLRFEEVESADGLEANLHDADGLVAHVFEAIPTWLTVGQEGVTLHGPDNWSGSDCEHGLASLTSGLKRLGARVRLELPAENRRPERAAVGPEGTRP